VPPSVVVVGDALLDIHVAPQGPMRIGADVPAVIEMAPGGQGMNLAVRLARRGHDVTLVCGLATDAAGDRLREAAGREGIALAPVAVAATGVVVVLVGPSGDRSMLSRRAAFAATDGPTVRTADWVVVSGYVLLEDAALHAAELVATMGRRRMVVGCAVPDAQLEAWRAAAGALRPDLVVLNRDESDRLRLDATAFVVTDPSGATASLGGATVTLARMPSDRPAVDTTGAGDAFAAALLAGLAAAWPPDRGALEAGMSAALAAAADVTRVVGAQAWIRGERGVPA
jgi:ribokinase